jgi:hypothetical protein
MSMLLITKELAEAVVKAHTEAYGQWCSHCESWLNNHGVLQHTPECIVTRAKLLLEQEWGIKS